jgi:N-hydroxyarylamine O-acetyltransferase
MAADYFDLDAWLGRIGYSGSRAPTLVTLRALIAAHTAAIPFECLDVFLGRVPKLDCASLQQKMIASARGGYCYEQNVLFRAGLRALGYRTTNLMARVIRGLPPDAERPAAHMVLRVDLAEGGFLVDVGFGNETPTAPLAMVPNQEQETPHETMRLLPMGDDMALQAMLGGAWQSIYRLSLRPVFDADYAVANWFNATHPESLFVTNMIAARPGSGRLRHTLFNGRLTTRRGGELVDRVTLPDAAACEAALRDTLRLQISVDDLAAALAEMARRGNQGRTHPFFT